MPSIESRGYWGDLIKGMSAQFADVFNQAKESYSLAINDVVATPGNRMSSVFKQKTTDAARERTASKSGLGYLQLTPEGQPFASDARIPGYTTTWAPVKFTNSVRVTQEAIEDRAYQDALDEFADLTVAGKESMDKHALGLFNYAFTAQASVPTSYSQYGDGKPMCSTLHPRKDGGTAQSNASSTGLPLDENNLETARVALARQLDDRGKPMRVGTGKLVLFVPFELEKTAAIITKGERRSGTANNDINIYDGMYTVVASQYIGPSFDSTYGATKWFLIDPRVFKLMFMLRKDLSSSRWIDNATKDVIFDIHSRWTTGYGDWRGVWGSLGDNAAYAS